MTESLAYPEPGTADPRAAAEYCAVELRRHDRERYLADLFAPPGPRAALFALHAFNLEVARIREIVSEPMLGQIRVQWWREALDGIFSGAPRRHAVALALAEAVKEHGLNRSLFDALLDAREADMDDTPPATLGALVEYARATSGGLVRLGLQACGTGDGAAHEAGEAAGIAHALAGLMRAVPFHARQRRVFLPTDVLAKAGLGAGDVIEGRDRAALSRACRAVACEARRHLDRARAARGAVPRQGRPALLPAALAAAALHRLEKAGYDPYRLQSPGPVGIQLRLTWASRTGRF